MTLAAPLVNRWGTVRNASTDQHTAGYASRSIAIRIEHDAGQYVATMAELPMFGEGDTPREAAVDLIRSLMSLRDQLAQSRGRLAPELDRQLTVLDHLLG
ncbi:MAG: hypothetical protein C0498_12440 [Anaerolinea sp.]|nr:hypothetical protein [Anaerolinea sp.]